MPIGVPNLVNLANNLDAVGDGNPVPIGRMATRVHRSQRTIYLSDAGVTMDGSFADVSVGTDVSTAVQTILDTASVSSPLTVVVDGVIKAKDLKLKSFTTLRGLGWGTGIVQAADSRSAVRNYNYRSPYTGGSHDGTIVDEDIVICDLQIHGNYLNAANNALRTGNWPTHLNYLKAKTDGELVHPVKMYGVRNLRIKNVYIRDPACFHINVGYISGGVFHNIRFNDSTHASAPLNGPNTAGLQVQGPATDIDIRNMWGDTSDDFLALNAEDWNLSDPPAADALQGPQGWGGSWDAVYKGPITHVRVDGLRMNTSSGIRVLSRDERVDDVVIRNVSGNVTLYALQTDYNGIPNYTGGAGNIGTLVIDGLRVARVNPTTGVVGYVNIACVAERIRIANVHRASLNSIYDAIYINGGATVNTLEIDGLQVSERESGSAGSHLIVQQGGTVNLMRISHVTWERYVDGGGPIAKAMFRFTGGAVNAVQISDVNVDNLSYVVSVAGGTLTDLQTTGLRHSNAGGAASVAVNAAIVTRYRASGSNTALLTSTAAGGVITGKRTDGTEDA